MTRGFTQRSPSTYIEIVGWWWILANLVDWWTTERAVSQYGLTELNPVLAPIVGTAWFFLVKTLVPIALLWWVWDKPRLTHHAIAFGTIIMLIVAAQNYLAV